MCRQRKEFATKEGKIFAIDLLFPVEVLLDSDPILPIDLKNL